MYPILRPPQWGRCVPFVRPMGDRSVVERGIDLIPTLNRPARGADRKTIRRLDTPFGVPCVMRENRTTDLHHPKGNEMNKFTKGAIATGAAVILLMGGAGT